MLFEKISFEQWEKDYRKYVKENAHEQAIRDLYDRIKVPKRATKFSAGYDFFIPHMYDVETDGDIILSGIRWNCEDIISKEYYIQRPETEMVLYLFARSSTAKKYGFSLMNRVGVVDMDYCQSDNEGHIMFLVDKAAAKTRYTFGIGDKIAQGVINHFIITTDDEPSELPKRFGGFGSTGT